MADMKQYIKGIDPEKIKKIIAIQDAYDAGEISKAEAKRRMHSEVGSLTAGDIALAEQEMKAKHADFQDKEKIQKMLDLFEGLIVNESPALAYDHPIACYLRENEALRKLLLAIEDLVQYPIIWNQWEEIYDKLITYPLHFSRKQMQLYSLLESKGFDRPTGIMWTLDDYVRDEIKEAKRQLDARNEEAFLGLQRTIVEDARDLMEKEEMVLYPTALTMINEAEFEDMKSGDAEIGFAFIEVAKPEAPKTASTSDNSGFAGELAQLLGKYGYANDPNQELDVSTGKLTLKQINLIFKNLPIDISFVDENELVKFYSDTNHRIFPRSKNVIGRDVKNCHPQRSVHIVEEILRKFKSGEQDSVDFWINKEGLFIYIYYVAVRDENGKFCGVLEMMQDALRIRNAVGSRTLLTWDEEDKGEAKKAEESGAVQITPESAEEANTEQHRPALTTQDQFTITPNTKLSDLLSTYPWMKAEIVKLRPAFQVLNTPLAKVMLPKATVKMMSERGGIALEELMEKLQEWIAKRR